MNVEQPDLQLLLERFFYLGKFEPFYSPRKKYVENGMIAEFERYFEQFDPASIITLMERHLLEFDFLPRKDEVWFLYALYLSSPRTSQAYKNIARAEFTRFAKTPEDLFLFARYAFNIQKQNNKKNVSRTTRKAITKWYLQKDSVDLIEMLSENRGMHGITHKDLIHLCHVPFSRDMNYFVQTFFRRCNRVVDENRKNSSTLTGNLKDLYTNCLLKICENPIEAKELIIQSDVKLKKVPTCLYDKIEVWEALLPNLSLHQMLKSMHYLTDSKILRQKKFSREFTKKLINKSFIRDSGVHPLTILIEKNKQLHLVRYANRLKQSHYSAKVKKFGIVVSPYLNKHLTRTFEESFNHIPRTGFRMSITINLQKNLKKRRIVNQPQVTCMEAAVALAFSYFRAENEVKVFTYREHNVPLKEIQWQQTNYPYWRAFEVCNNLLQPRNFQRLHIPVQEALQHENVYDLFLIIVSSSALGNKKATPETLIQQLNIYKEAKNKSAKVVIVNLHRYKPGLTHRTAENDGILELCGIDENTTRIINAFGKKVFY